VVEATNGGITGYARPLTGPVCHHDRSRPSLHVPWPWSPQPDARVNQHDRRTRAAERGGGDVRLGCFEWPPRSPRPPSVTPSVPTVRAPASARTPAASGRLYAPTQFIYFTDARLRVARRRTPAGRQPLWTDVVVPRRSAVRRLASGTPGRWMTSRRCVVVGEPVGFREPRFPGTIQGCTG